MFSGSDMVGALEVSGGENHAPPGPWDGRVSAIGIGLSACTVVRYESYIHIFSHIGIPCTISYESKLVMSPDLSNMRTFRLDTSSYVLSAR